MATIPQQGSTLATTIEALQEEAHELGHDEGFAAAILAVQVILDGARMRGKDAEEQLELLLAHIALYQEFRA